MLITKGTESRGALPSPFSSGIGSGFGSGGGGGGKMNKLSSGVGASSGFGSGGGGGMMKDSASKMASSSQLLGSRFGEGGMVRGSKELGSSTGLPLTGTSSSGLKSSGGGFPGITKTGGGSGIPSKISAITNGVQTGAFGAPATGSGFIKQTFSSPSKDGAFFNDNSNSVVGASRGVPGMGSLSTLPMGGVKFGSTSLEAKSSSSNSGIGGVDKGVPDFGPPSSESFGAMKGKQSSTLVGPSSLGFGPGMKIKDASKSGDLGREDAMNGNKSKFGGWPPPPGLGGGFGSGGGMIKDPGLPKATSGVGRKSSSGTAVTSSSGFGSGAGSLKVSPKSGEYSTGGMQLSPNSFGSSMLDGSGFTSLEMKSSSTPGIGGVSKGSAGFGSSSSS